MAYKIKRKKQKVKPLTFRQSKLLFETLRNDTSLNGKEIMDLNKKLREKKLLKRGYD